MSDNKGSALGGAIFLALASVALLLGGGILLMSGLNALEACEISVTYSKRGAAILLRPDDSPWRYYAEVWGRLLLGTLLVAASVAVPVKVLFMPSARRAERLRVVSTHGRLRSGPNVSAFAACLVIAAFLAFLALAT